VKLVLHAMHENELPFINGGEHISWAPEIPIWVSLGVIILTLGITTILSLRKSRSTPTPDSTDSTTGDPSAADSGAATGPEAARTAAAAAAGGGELDEATRAEIEGIEEPEQTDSKKA
jgi:tellurite resistance protein TerC